MASSQSSRQPPSSSNPLDLEITIVSAKHLKNVNWRSGDLKPYAIFWLDPDRRLATKADTSGSTRPVWNERFTLPINLPVDDALLTLEVFHSKPSETPKPLIGSLRLSLKDLVDRDDSNRVRKFELRRPSGRPHGKICLKLGLRDRPVAEYHHAPPQSSYYYSSAPPQPHFPPVHDHRSYNPSPYALHPQMPSPPPPPLAVQQQSQPPYPSYHSYPDNRYPFYQQPPPFYQPPFYDRQPCYEGPSAPVDYAPYEQKPKGSQMGVGTGLAVGAVTGALGGLALEEGLKYEEEKTAERVENDIAARVLSRMLAAAARDDYRGSY